MHQPGEKFTYGFNTLIFWVIWWNIFRAKSWISFSRKEFLNHWVWLIRISICRHQKQNRLGSLFFEER
jgi:hypothetical protein